MKVIKKTFHAVVIRTNLYILLGIGIVCFIEFYKFLINHPKCGGLYAFVMGMILVVCLIRSSNLEFEEDLIARN